jgi:hypothetical protein
MGRYLLFFLCFLVSVSAFSQVTAEVKGIVADSAGSFLQGATVKLRSGRDSIATVTGKDGAFSLRLTAHSSLSLEITSISYEPFVKVYPLVARTEVGMIRLASRSTVMPEIVVTSVNPITVKEDTIEYKASAYKVREGAMVEEIIKKLPGVTVEKDGQVIAQGKPVQRVRVNGKDFFGGDAQTALQNLPAEIIDNIQIIEDYGDQANLTGIKNGDPERTLNINVRKDKNNGKFGTASIAAGTEDRYAAAMAANDFKGERQLSFLANLNNTNANLFNFNGGGRGGGARGANFGGLERNNNGGNGVTLSKAVGFNYRNNWGKKIAVNGSYSYTSRSTTSITTSQQQDINPVNNRFIDRNSNSNSISHNHRATFNFEYRIDSMNFLKISPYISVAVSESDSRSQSAISRKGYFTLNNNQSANQSSAPNGGVDLSYNHKFSKRGRNINLFASYDYSYRDQDRQSQNSYANDDSTYSPVLHTDTMQQQTIGTINKNTRTVMRLSYTEPFINKYTFLEVNYEWNRSATNNKKTVEDIDPASSDITFNPVQSNHFDYQFITNRVALNIKGGRAKYNYIVGMVSQPSNLSGQSVGKNIYTNYHNINWIPSARFVYNFARSHSLTFTYGGTSREPDFFQIQPVADSTNLNNIVVGNPNLQAELTRRMSIRYNRFDSKTGRSLFTNISFDQTDNKIVNNRLNNPSGTGRTTTYLNTSGFNSVNANGSITRPFNNRKLSATLNFNGSYNNNISFIDSGRTRGNNWNIRPGAVFRVDFDDIIDASLNVNYTFYKTTTRYPEFTDVRKARTLNIGLNGRNYFFKDLTIGYDLTKAINYGFSSNVNSNPLIINLYAEYRFLKKKQATIKLQGYDLLNENTGITRTVFETTITDSRNNRLARYFLLLFNYRLQKFGEGGGGGNRRPGFRA